MTSHVCIKVNSPAELRFCASKGCTLPASYPKKCVECSDIHQHDGYTPSCTYSKLITTANQFQSKELKSDSEDRINGLISKINENFESLTELYISDKKEIESKLIIAKEHARIIGLVHIQSPYLVGDDVFNFIEAVKSPNGVFENETEVKETLAILENIYTEHYTRILAEVNNLSLARQQFKETYKRLKVKKSEPAELSQPIKQPKEAPKVIEVEHSKKPIRSRDPRPPRVTDEEVQKSTTDSASMTSEEPTVRWQQILPKQADPDAITYIRDIEPDTVFNLVAKVKYFDEEVGEKITKKFFQLFDSTGSVKAMCYDNARCRLMKDGAVLRLNGVTAKLTIHGRILVHPIWSTEIEESSETIEENPAVKNISQGAWRQRVPVPQRWRQLSNE